MYGHIHFTTFRKHKDFDPILFEYSMLLNSEIEKEHFSDILRKYQFHQSEKLSYIYK